MSVVKINAITVPRERFDEFERRFAARAGRVEAADGFEGFELLRPNDEREVCLVVTRWRSEEDFRAWVAGARLRRGHTPSIVPTARSERPARSGRSTCSSASRRPPRSRASLSGMGTIARLGELAQLVEHTTENRGVPGSSPGLAIL